MGAMEDETILTGRRRLYIIPATLMVLFLGALDTLVMTAAMPSIVAELGGLHLYSWVFSAYMLSRAVSLPIFGKLSDLYPNRTLYAVSILIFLAGSVFAGISATMTQLTLSRVVQGIGAGGNFALVYIVLSDISTPERRGKMMSLASFVWGLASVLGPTFGGFMVAYVSWRWIFFVNLPLGALSLAGILWFLEETRKKRAAVSLDLAGAATLCAAILSLLTAFLLAGETYPWSSPPIIGLFALAVLSAVAFHRAEVRAREPILSIDFFRIPRFRLGNGTVFFSSFTIFTLSAFSPLFIQGSLGRSPAQLGFAMMFLSGGWSAGALLCGQTSQRVGERRISILGAAFLMAGSAILAGASSATPLWLCSLALFTAGIGMGFVSIATLLVVQNSVGTADLGVATSSHQFTRTLGGTIGVGVTGGIVTGRFLTEMERLAEKGAAGSLPPEVIDLLRNNVENLFRPEVREILSPDLLRTLQGAMADGLQGVFLAALASAAVCLALALLLPGRNSR